MKKFWIFLVSGIVIFSVCFVLTRNHNKVNENQVKSITDEKEIVEKNDIKEPEYANETVKVNSSNVVVSPNCIITMKKVYLKCNHTIEEKINVPNEVVNMNLEELRLYYNEWNVEKFTSSEVILYRTYSNSCDQHYILKDKDDFITIYKEKDNGDIEEIEQTEIFVDFLPEEDKVKLKNGIRAVGKEELNSLLEDFE